MASMTDVIFLLLIFFMVTSTVVIPNAIKVTLPQAQKQTAAKPIVRCQSELLRGIWQPT